MEPKGLIASDGQTTLLILHRTIYPLNVVQSAAAALSGKIEAAIEAGDEDETKIFVTLRRMDVSVSSAKVRWLFNRELIGSLGINLALTDGNSMRRIFMESAFSVASERH